MAARGIAVALLDAASDGSVRRYEDTHEVVRYVRSLDNVRVWLTGWSFGTVQAVDFAVELPPDESAGVVLFAPYTVPERASSLKLPVLVVYRPDDSLSAPVVDQLFDSLTAVPSKERVALPTDGVGCSLSGVPAAHSLPGNDADIIAATTGFIVKNSPKPATVIPSVEYY